MAAKKLELRNFIQIDEKQIDSILAQLSTSYSVIENLKAKFGFSYASATFELEANSRRDTSVVRKIARLERYLERNRLISTARPRRMPHALLNSSQYWWVKETFTARRVTIPASSILKTSGAEVLTVWVSDPKRAPKPRHEWDFTGSFLFLPTMHYDEGKTSTVWSGCSALRFIANAALGQPLTATDPNESLGRFSTKHPIEKLAELNATVHEARRLESLYYVRYITNEQTYLVKDREVRVNDVVGYPIYISAYPELFRSAS
ncbi:hypothetical protein V1290_000509 [Bradyrhizobium sp. AZCC 1578]|uniref:hypothetical protein n=1 Tax=unclassified Bradyrhizobium TaxID=2631580 RepID=UPI002FEFB988